MKGRKEYRIIGAYDSETTNYEKDGRVMAFPILHQLGLLDGTSLQDITPENVEDHVHIELYRHCHDLYTRLDQMVETVSDYVPVDRHHPLQ